MIKQAYDTIPPPAGLDPSIRTKQRMSLLRLIRKVPVWQRCPFLRTRKDIWSWNVGRDLLGMFSHLELKGQVHMVPVFHGLYWLKVTMSSRSRGLIGSCDTRKAKQTAWMQRVPHVPFSLDKQKLFRKHKQDRQR